MPTVQALRGCSTEGRGQAYWGWHTSWAGVFWGGSGSLPTGEGEDRALLPGTQVLGRPLQLLVLTPLVCSMSAHMEI